MFTFSVNVFRKGVINHALFYYYALNFRRGLLKGRNKLRPYNVHTASTFSQLCAPIYNLEMLDLLELPGVIRNQGSATA
jgi:hypothetical protein